MKRSEDQAPLLVQADGVYQGLNSRLGSVTCMRKGEKVTGDENTQKSGIVSYLNVYVLAHVQSVSFLQQHCRKPASSSCFWGDSLGVKAGDPADKELSIILRINELTHHCKHCAGGF